MTKIGDPNDAATATPESRNKHLVALIGSAGAVIGTILLLAVASWLAGWIGLGGIGWAVMLAFMLGAMVVHALIWRAIRHGR
jgi:hypothetical protein